MKNKVCIITGSTSGIGLEAAKSMSYKGFQVILACRNIAKARVICEKINAEIGNENAEYIELDLSSFDSIESFASEFKSRHERLDILINNAGTISDRHHKTKQGFELTMGVNYIGHYYLSELLLPTMLNTPKARIVNVSSIVGLTSKLEDEILNFHDIKHGMHAYCASKLSQILYTIDLSERIIGNDITVNALHPGVIGTNIWSGEGVLMKLTNPLMKLLFPSAKHGAKNIVYLATSKDVKNETGSFFIKSKKTKLKNSSLNHELRERLIKKTNAAINEVTQCQKNIAN